MNSPLKELLKSNDVETLFYSLMSQSPVSCQIHNLDGSLLHTNPAFSIVHGICEEALMGLYEKYNIIFDEQAIDLGLAPYIQRVFKGETVSFPVYAYELNKTLSALNIKNCTPKLTWLKTQGFPIKDSNDTISHIGLLSEDITEQKLAEQEVENSHLFSESLIKAANMMIVGIDVEGRITTFNPEAERLSGYSFKEVKGKDWFQTLVPNNRRPEIYEEFSRLLTGASPKSFINPIVTKKGEERIISWTNMQIVENDKYAGVISFGIDITDLEQAKEEILDSEAKFRSLFNEAGYAMTMSKGPKGALVEVNREFLKLFGYKQANEAVGKSVADFVVAEDRQRLSERVFKTSRGEYVPSNVSYTGLRKDHTTFLMDIKISQFQMNGEIITLSIIIDVTDRVKLQKERDRIFNLSNNLIGVAGLDGSLKQINPAWEKLLGYPTSEIKKKLFLDFIHPDDVEKTYRQMERLGAGIHTQDFENRYIHKDGSVRYIAWTSIPDVEEQLLYSIGVDITAKKMARQALVESEEKYRNLIENMTDGVLLVQEDKVQFVNEVWCKLSGFSREALVGKPFADFIGEEQLPEILNKYNKRVLEQDSKLFEIQLEFKNGRIVDLELTISLTVYLGNEAILVVGKDISERKRVEAAMVESEEKFRLIVEQSPLPILIFKMDGFLDRVNLAWQKMWELSDEALEGVLENYNILTGELPNEQEIRPLIERIFKGEEVVLPFIEYDAKAAMKEAGIELKAPSLWISVNYYPIKNNNGEVVKVVGLVDNQTERREKEREILEYQKRLQDLALELTYSEEKQRKEIATDLHDDVGQLLVSSRIQIASIKSSMERELIFEKLNSVSKGLMSAITATRQAIFDLSPPQLNEMGLEAALADWVEFEMEEKYGIETVFIGEDRKYPIGNEIRYLLFRCVRELLINIIKHAHATEARLTVREKNHILNITIEDNGIGFNYNSKLSGKHNNAGFGLFSVKERIQNIGGSLNIDSSKKKGSKIEMQVLLKKEFDKS